MPKQHENWFLCRQENLTYECVLNCITYFNWEPYQCSTYLIQWTARCSPDGHRTFLFGHPGNAWCIDYSGRIAHKCCHRSIVLLAGNQRTGIPEQNRNCQNLIHSTQSTDYMTDMVQLAAASASRPGLRSASHLQYRKPALKTKFGERAFSHAGPAAWNSLPQYIQSATNTHSFQNKLKTFLFKSYF